MLVSFSLDDRRLVLALDFRSAIGGGILFLLAMFVSGIFFVWVAPMLGMDPTIQIGITLSGFIFALIAYVLYAYSKSTSIGRKIHG